MKVNLPLSTYAMSNLRVSYLYRGKPLSFVENLRGKEVIFTVSH